MIYLTGRKELSKFSTHTLYYWHKLLIFILLTTEQKIKAAFNLLIHILLSYCPEVIYPEPRINR